MAEPASRLRAALAKRYTIDRELGRGATANVYLALDLKHHRQVAIKVLKPELATLLGPERFLREIQIAAHLAHPHILPLYDSGDAAGFLYYVMPYVAGESLRARLQRERQLPVDEALELIRTLAGALDYAHRQGVIHRDIKPANILLQDGQALLADFGIARAMSSAPGERLTETGLSVGTPQYMSPEQVTGERSVGPQSDIYSLGAVAYEMLVGEPPVTGPSAEAILARAVLEAPRPIRTVRPAVPRPVEAAILKALARAPVDRFRTAGEFASALPVALPAEVEAVAPRRRWWGARRTTGVVAAVALAIGAFALGRRLFAPPASTAVTRRQLTFSGDAVLCALSPDGQFLAYETSAGDTNGVVVQDLSGGAADTIAMLPRVNTLEWSPDGKQLLVGAALRAVLVPRLGGRGRTLPWPEQSTRVHAYWFPDGSRVSLHTAGTRRLLVYDLATGDSTSVPVGGAYRWLFEGSWSPNGRFFAMAAASFDPIAWSIRTVDTEGETETVAEDSVPLGSPRWSPEGDAVFYARGTDAIWRVAVSPTTGRAVGSPRMVYQQLGILPNDEGQPNFALSRDGRSITFAAGAEFSNLWVLEPRGVKAPPLLTQLTRGTALHWGPAVSPDGRWIAFAREAGGGAELFRMPIEGGPATQVTFGARVRRQSQIAWSPDGRQLAFVSLRAGRAQVWLANVEGGRVHPLDRTGAGLFWGQLTWAPGARIAYQGPKTRSIVLVDPTTGDERPLLSDSTTGLLFSPRYSPAGDQLAVNWSRLPSDLLGVWIFDLRDSSSARRIGQQLGPRLWPRGWSADGRYLYAEMPRALYRLDARSGQTTEAIASLPWRNVDCTPAGPRRPDAWICAVFDFTSDVWTIENTSPAP